MSTFGLSIRDDLHKEIDSIAETWGCNRSVAITRIYLEWKQAKETRPLIDPLNPRLPVVLTDGQQVFKSGEMTAAELQTANYLTKQHTDGNLRWQFASEAEAVPEMA